MATHEATFAGRSPAILPVNWLREARICWSFTRRDLSATVIPATIFAIAAWAHTGHQALSLLVVAVKCLVYFWLYIYTFNLSNQLIGIEEDRLNKPERPLVTGLVTPRGAWWRLAIVTALFLAAGAALGVLWWTLLWVAAWVFHNHLGGARRFWGKNAAMVAGTIAQLAAAWQIVTPLSTPAWTWILAIAVPLGLLVSLQDLRDVQGDLAIGRRTAVTVFGDRACRYVFAVAFAVYPFGLYALLYRHTIWPAVALGGVCAAVAFTIAYRVVAMRTPRADHRTYMLYTYWYCLTLASAVAALAHHSHMHT
ncbi:UbiA family prenyltransferase [Nocardia alni]|uniref:UbiA family prenyltransferase n=1 Tax=Nocardia alni TaxID=2815723 RepID=UPI001C238576|nr:UbiA family prenyltransferase [Nocardia alni]